MNAKVEKILELYQELIAICDSNGIRYITGGQTADMILNSNNRDHFKGVIYITDTEPDEMLELLKKDLAPDRELEVVKEEGRKDRIRYINKNTSFIEFSSAAKYRHPGLHVEIIPCEEKTEAGDYIFFNAHDLPEKFSSSMMKDIKTYLYKGRGFQMPSDLQAYFRCLYKNEEGKLKVPVITAEKYITSSVIAYADILGRIADIEKIGQSIHDLENDIAERSARIDERNAEMDVVLDKVKDLYGIKVKKINLH